MDMAPQANIWVASCEQCEQAIYLLEESHIELYDGAIKV